MFFLIFKKYDNKCFTHLSHSYQWCTSSSSGLTLYLKQFCGRCCPLVVKHVSEWPHESGYTRAEPFLYRSREFLSKLIAGEWATPSGRSLKLRDEGREDANLGWIRRKFPGKKVLLRVFESECDASRIGEKRFLII